MTKPPKRNLVALAHESACPYETLKRFVSGGRIPARYFTTGGRRKTVRRSLTDREWNELIVLVDGFRNYSLKRASRQLAVARQDRIRLTAAVKSQILQLGCEDGILLLEQLAHCERSLVASGKLSIEDARIIGKVKALGFTGPLSLTDMYPSKWVIDGLLIAPFNDDIIWSAVFNIYGKKHVLADHPEVVNLLVAVGRAVKTAGKATNDAIARELSISVPTLNRKKKNPNFARIFRWAQHCSESGRLLLQSGEVNNSKQTLGEEIESLRKEQYQDQFNPFENSSAKR